MSQPNSKRRAAHAAPASTAEGDLFSEILDAPDRDRIPGARAVVSFDARDEPEFLAAIDAAASATYALSRRGVWHGEWAELDPSRFPPESVASADLAPRWHAGRPIVLAGAASAEIIAFADVIRGRAQLHAELKEPGGLRAWLAEELRELEPRLRISPARAVLFDAERDIERWLVTASAASGKKLAQDLWVKSAWLSTFEGEDSLRVRVGFGRERADDGSRDLMRHRFVAELAEALFPESALIAHNPKIAHVVERIAAEPVLFTQHIAYWNSEGGGALFHHDAFAEDGPALAHEGQLGVCYLQLSGRTAWLALSIQDLAARVREYVGYLADGEAPWVRAQVFAGAPSFDMIERLVRDDARLVAELALPGCGALGALVNRGPEFSAFLADAGHAVLLQPGDAILLPNRGWASTTMHSVFCAGDETGFSLSLAIRPDRDVVSVDDDAEELAEERPLGC